MAARAVGDLAAQLSRAAADASLFPGGASARAPFVFCDLETTGLSGGAGTYAFLVGCGWFDEAGAFVMRQHVLTEYGVERAMLGRVAEEFLRAGAVVSFNGKSFDAPVLETRYLFHRLEWTGARLPHIDVLHPARRFWGTSGAGPRPSCSLIALEEDILGVRRVGDSIARVRDSGALLSVHPQRGRAAPSGRPRTQQARSRVARRAHRPPAGACARRPRSRGHAVGSAGPRPSVRARGAGRARAPHSSTQCR